MCIWYDNLLYPKQKKIQKKSKHKINMAYSVYKLKTIVIQKGIKINMKNQKNYRIQDNMKNN